MTERELNIIRGKCFVGHATVEEMLKVFSLMDKMEELLDEGDMEDMYGTQGWRFSLGLTN